MQEQGGIHNSHAEILLAREKAKWEQAKAKELDALKAAAPRRRERCARIGATATPDAGAGPATAGRGRRGRRRRRSAIPDEAWIETARCPSCNECQNINDKMFKYNDNKQAYIVDVKLGTYRQMVEAAEACQVAIIHPGKPWNPSEPGPGRAHRPRRSVPLAANQQHAAMSKQPTVASPFAAADSPFWIVVFRMRGWLSSRPALA